MLQNDPQMLWQHLQNLKDIHLPVAPSWFPPAIGWWLTAMIIFACVALCGYLLIRRHRYRVPISQALKELQELTEVNANPQSPQGYSIFLLNCNALLKRVARLKCPEYSNTDVAILHGDKWRDFLARTSSSRAPLPPEHLIYGLYKPNQQTEIETVEKWVRNWLLYRGKSS